MRTTAMADLGASQSMNVAGVPLTLVNITTSTSNRTVYMPGYGSLSETIDTSVWYSLGGHPAGVATALLQYYPGKDAFVPLPSIQSSIGGDLYIVITQTPSVIQATSAAFFNGTLNSPASVVVTAQFIPEVLFVWLGAALMLMANLPYVFLGPKGASSESGLQGEAEAKAPEPQRKSFSIVGH
jgi:hypothetical protein